jgi:4-hydroxybenzoate polyprenyltransferase
MLNLDQMNATNAESDKNKSSVLYTLFLMSRPINLLLIIYAFFCFRIGLGSKLQSEFNFMAQLGHYSLLLTILLTASAGNFINDYFDKKVDAINKPNLNTIDKNIKRRVVILAHITTNLFALLCAWGASYLLSSWMPLVITPLIIFILTIYTPFLKKRYVLGNIAVSLCIAIIPIWALWPEVIRISNSYVQSWVFVFMLFAFFISMTRELVKDIEDVDGDREGMYNTVAVKSGITVAKAMGLFTLFTTLLIAVFAWFLYLNEFQMWIKQTYLLIVLFPIAVSFFLLLLVKHKKGYSYASLALKITMFLGITFSLFLA